MGDCPLPPGRSPPGLSAPPGRRPPPGLNALPPLLGRREVVAAGGGVFATGTGVGTGVGAGTGTGAASGTDVDSLFFSSEEDAFVPAVVVGLLDLDHQLYLLLFLAYQETNEH